MSVEVKPDGNKLYSATEQGSRAAEKEKKKGKKNKRGCTRRKPIQEPTRGSGESKEEHQDGRRTGIRRVCMYNDDGGEEASVLIAVGIPNGALVGSSILDKVQKGEKR